MTETADFTVHFRRIRPREWTGWVQEQPHLRADATSLSLVRRKLDLLLRKELTLIGAFQFNRSPVNVSEVWRGSPEAKH